MPTHLERWWARRFAPLPTYGSFTDRLSPSVLLALHPVLEHLQRHGAVLVGGLGESAVVAFADPALVGGGVVARQRQPHQAASRLPRQPVAGEQHLAEHGLRLMLALLGGQTKPASAVAEIVP